MSVRVRIAPSPTGYFHIGTGRTALFNFLFARKMGGTFILRVEDTDKERSSAEYGQDIYDSFDWLGLSFDEKYVQSEHQERHKELLRQLVANDRAYISKETAKDDPTRTVEVVRLRNPGRSITFNDIVRGDITFDTTELKDFVIARTIDDPLYHFAVVADDGDANISHVIRGEDHISNTPRQILIQEALELPRPIYAHLPLILAPDRSKMSKRKHQTAMRDFRAKGYLPDAMVNFMALLGWSPGETEKEIYTMQELIGAFSLEGIHKAGAVFNEEKLRWFNGEYLKLVPESDFETTALQHLRETLTPRVPFNEKMARAIIPIVKERLSTWGDIRSFADAGEYDFFFQTPTLDAAKIPDKKSTQSDAKEHLAFALGKIETLHEDFTGDDLKAQLWDYATEKGRAAVLWPLRYALSGRDKSPDPFTLAHVLQKEETEKRVKRALLLLN